MLLICWAGLAALVPVSGSMPERLTGMTCVPLAVGSNDGSPSGHRDVERDGRRARRAQVHVVVDELAPGVDHRGEAARIEHGVFALGHERVRNGSRAGQAGDLRRGNAVGVVSAAGFARVVGSGAAPERIGEVVAGAVERAVFGVADLARDKNGKQRDRCDFDRR